MLRITDTAISGPGYIPRRLSRTARVALLRDIATLEIAKLRKQPFNGTCPTAFDGTESIYQFPASLMRLRPAPTTSEACKRYGM